MGEHQILHEAETGADRAVAAQLPRTHVLIIDDQDASRRICASYCDLFDHTSETAKSQAEAVEALAHRRFDVVVMNVHMDGAAGLEALRAIRELPPPAAKTPIIGLAAPERAGEAQRWLAAGVSGLVAKPVTASRLFAAIKSVLDPQASTARSWAPTRAG